MDSGDDGCDGICFIIHPVRGQAHVMLVSSAIH